MFFISAAIALILLMTGDLVLSEEKCIRFSGCDNSVLTTVNSTVTLSLKLEHLCGIKRFGVDKITAAASRTSGRHPPEIFCELILEENKSCLPDASCWCQPEDNRFIISREVSDPTNEVWIVSADVYKGKNKSLVRWTFDVIINDNNVDFDRARSNQAPCDTTGLPNSSGMIGYIWIGLATTFLALVVVVICVFRRRVIKVYYKRKGRRHTYTIEPECPNSCPSTLLRTCLQLPNIPTESVQNQSSQQVSLPVVAGSSTVRKALMPPARLRAS